MNCREVAAHAVCLNLAGSCCWGRRKRVLLHRVEDPSADICKVVSLGCSSVSSGRSSAVQNYQKRRGRLHLFLLIVAEGQQKEVACACRIPSSERTATNYVVDVAGP